MYNNSGSYSSRPQSESIFQQYERILVEWRIRIILICIFLLLLFLNLGSTTIFPQFFPLFLLVVLMVLLMFYSYQSIKSNLLRKHPQYIEYFRFFESLFSSLNPSKEKILNESFSNRKKFPMYEKQARNLNFAPFEAPQRSPVYAELPTRTTPYRDFTPNSPFRENVLEPNSLRSKEKKRHASTEPLDIKKKRDFGGDFQKNRDQRSNAPSIAKNIKEILPPSNNEQNLNPNVRNRYTNITVNHYVLNPQTASKSVSISKQPRKQIIPQGNSTLFELNQRYFLEAESCFKKLKIEGNMTAWMGNCQRWIFKNVLYQFLQENMENIHDLNNELTSYFGKYLFEIQLFEDPETNHFRDSRFIRVTLDDLMLNYEMIKKNQTVFAPLTSNIKEINKINEKMRGLLASRERLERIIKIPGFENFQIRNYVFDRLLAFHKQETEGIQFLDGMRNMKQPSDNQILANFFLNYINIESYKNLGSSNQFYFTSQIVQANHFAQRQNNEVHFQQINPSYFEPHYQILSGDQIWSTLPGKNNVICCIVLFFLHVKLKMDGIFGIDHSKTQRALACIFNG